MAQTTAASPQAMQLLGEVLARVPGVGRPVIQILPACAIGDAQHPARELATAAVHGFGRTLLVAGEPDASDSSCVRGLSWLVQELRGGEPTTILPDGLIAGLYHTRWHWAAANAGADPQDGPPLGDWLADRQAFRMVVVEGVALSTDPRGIATAARCDGCVLTVRAGVTRLDDIRVATRQLTCAGARLLGIVLDGVPATGPGLFRSRRLG